MDLYGDAGTLVRAGKGIGGTEDLEQGGQVGGYLLPGGELAFARSFTTVDGQDAKLTPCLRVLYDYDKLIALNQRVSCRYRILQLSIKVGVNDW